MNHRLPMHFQVIKQIKLRSPIGLVQGLWTHGIKLWKFTKWVPANYTYVSFVDVPSRANSHDAFYMFSTFSGNQTSKSADLSEKSISPREPLTDKRAMSVWFIDHFNCVRDIHRNTSKHVTRTLLSAVLVSRFLHFSKSRRNVPKLAEWTWI